MLPFHGWNEGNFTFYAITRVWQFLVQAAIPSITIIFLNVAVYKRLKLLRESEAFKQADEALKKSIVRAQLSMWIAIIFVISQFIVWLRLPYDVRYIFARKIWINFFFIHCRSSLGQKTFMNSKLETIVKQCWLLEH